MEPFDLPPYPYDRLNEYRALAAERHGALIDMSIGAPFDAPPQIVVDALSSVSYTHLTLPTILLV